MTIQTVVSVVRSLLPSLPLWLIVAGCTWSHTGGIARQVTSDLGLRKSVTVSRSSSWRLYDQASLYLADPVLVGSLKRDYPRLGLVLSAAMEAELQERFASYTKAEAGQTLQQSLSAAVSHSHDVLLRLYVQQVDDRLSSPTEWADDKGFTELGVGRDHLQLLLKIFDVRSGRLLDTISVESHSGWWRWREHQVAELLTPTLSAMFEQLRVRQLAHRQP